MRVATALLLLGTNALAGLIYGTVTVNGQPVANTDIGIHCTSDHPGRTDSRGSYAVKVTETGRCTISLRYANTDVTTDVISGKSSARRNFQIVRDENQSWVLRRR